MIGVIYLIKNEITNRYYVGQTHNNVLIRFAQHKYQRKNPKYKLHHSIKKHGIQNFSIQELCCCLDQQELDKMENHFILQYDSVKNGYNETYGGNCKGMLTEETKQKISKANKGKLIKDKNPMYGKTHDEEALEKISKASIGRIDGEKNPKAKITKEIVILIRENKILSRKELSVLYNLTLPTIEKIINNKIWKF